MTRRLSLLLPDLRGGGAERVNLLLLKQFIAKGYDVDLVLLRKTGELLDQVPAGARIIDLQVQRVREGFIPLVQYLRSHCPDAFMASMWPLTTMGTFAARVAGYQGRVVVSEHSSLSCAPENDGLSGLALRASMRWVNGRADSVVGVSAGVLDDLRSLGLPVQVGHVIYNPVAISGENRVPSVWRHHPWMRCPPSRRLLAVGSLKLAKDYPTLLAAVNKIINSGTQVSLLILGTGALKDELEERSWALGLSEYVHFGGFVSDPAPFYRAAGVFVLSSSWEGFGNVIVEALASGTPVVSTNCRSGPAEILENGRYGTLVPVGDHEALGNAIVESLASRHDSVELRARAKEFSVERICEEYLQILK